MQSLDLLHHRQTKEADCLVACAAMILTYLEVEYRYTNLAIRLKTEEHGTVFGNLISLKSLGINVEIDESDDYRNVGFLTDTLHEGIPVIASVDTAELLTYWTKTTSHALVIMGIDEEHILVNDPAFDEAPQFVPIDEFLLAWSEHNYRYAIFTKK